MEKTAAPLQVKNSDAEPLLKTTKSPLQKNPTANKLSISAALSTQEPDQELKVEQQKEKQASNHFTETDLTTIWSKFLADLQQRDVIIFSAIQSFKMHKKDENTIEVQYPSESARTEFEQVKAEFFNHFMHKVNHFNIEVKYRKDVALKKEVLTKRNIFDKFAEINPVLKDLDETFKLDFT